MPGRCAKGSFEHDQGAIWGYSSELDHSRSCLSDFGLQWSCDDVVAEDPAVWVLILLEFYAH